MSRWSNLKIPISHFPVNQPKRWREGQAKRGGERERERKHTDMATIKEVKALQIFDNRWNPVSSLWTWSLGSLLLSFFNLELDSFFWLLFNLFDSPEKCGNRLKFLLFKRNCPTLTWRCFPLFSIVEEYHILLKWRKLYAGRCHLEWWSSGASLICIVVNIQFTLTADAWFFNDRIWYNQA